MPCTTISVKTFEHAFWLSDQQNSGFKVLFLPILVWKARLFGASLFGTRGEPESIRFARVFSLSRKNLQKNRIIRNRFPESSQLTCEEFPA
jgi:hypothetical protein